MIRNTSQRWNLLWAFIFYIIPTTINAQGICNPDVVPPILIDCPGDASYNIPANECGVLVEWSPPTVESDDCDSVNAISSVDFFTFHTGQGDGNNGQFILHGTDSFTIVGTTNGTPGNGNNRFSVCFYSTCAGMLSFKWRARMNNGDGFISDRARLTLIKNRIPDTISANVNFDLTPADDAFAEGDVGATLILPGDRFCIDVQSDNTDGVDSITIRELIFVPLPIDVMQTKGPEPFSTLPEGIYPVEYTATDCGGNTSYCNFTITVLPPDPVDLINCQANLTIQLPGATICDTLLNWAIPVAQVCGPVNGFQEEMNPFIQGVQLSEAAEMGMGDGIVGTDGIVYLNPAKDSLIIIGINNGTYGTPRHDTSIIQVCILPRCPGTISFDWSAFVERFQNFDRDEAGIIFNGKDSILSAPGFSDNAAGSVTFETDGINPLCFYVRSTNFLSEDTLTVRNFIYTPTATQVIQVAGPDINDPLEPGMYHFAFNARDCFGNEDSCSFDATIIGAPRGAMACKNLNVSLNENCEALITPEMLVSGVCTAAMIVELTHYGTPVPNPIDSHYLWQHIIATVRDTLNGNSCWSDLVIEDKLAPVIICRADTVDCNLLELEFPLNYDGHDCSHYTVSTIDERVEHFNCNDLFLKAIYRDIEIKDFQGNTDQCTDTIYVKRIKADDVVLPTLNFFNFTCTTKYFKDQNGNPSPVVTRVPYIIQSDGTKNDIWPLNELLDCNIFISYEDIDLGEINCVRKIMRTWTVREWWCGAEITRQSNQLIIIKDAEGPVITHAPYGFEATTGRRDCEARVLLPSIEAFDYCHDDLRIDIAYPGGILVNQNGGYANLPVGEDTVYYRIYDGCYNLTEYYIIIHVKDETAPVAVCDRNTVIGLNHSGYNWIPAEVFDDGSFDECSLHHFEVRRMDSAFCGTRGLDDWSPEVGFCCDDVGHTIMVGLKAIDHSGNEAICMVSVEVQDKDRPLITCLPNITVDCRFDIDYNHLEVFGKIVTDTADREKIIIDPRYYHVIGGHPLDGIAQDNCPPTILVSVDKSNINQCGLGYIIRSFVAEDRQGNRSDICYQYITVINHESFDSTDIVWPLDLETTGICDPNELIPERLNPPYDKPVVSDDECSLIGLSYEDQVFSPTLPGDPCFKILRTWSVIDWCQRDIYGNIIIWSHLQIIKVRNEVDPVITRISPDTVICSYDLNCNPIAVQFSIEATDDCTPIDQMLYTYKIDFDGDGTIDVTRAALGGNVAEGIWPIGRHIVKWEVEDRCGNTAKSHFVLDLRNCKSPVAYCFNGLSTNLTPMDTDGDGIADTAIDTVWAKDFDAGSYHNCGYHVALSFSADTNDTYRIYNCDSIFGSTLKTVELWVTDINGNTSFCRTFIDVQDNSHFCPPSLKNSNVEGLIATEKNDRVQNVSIALTNSGMNEVKTDVDGKYSFFQIPNGQIVTVKPSKNDDWLNGVSTADIVKIQRHILGLESLNSAYKMIAADVNKSKSITAKDVSDLRRLILGITSEIAGNTSWRFVHQLYSFNDVNSALNQNFPESYEINPLKGNMNLDFYAIKTGDVNTSAATKGFNKNISRNRNVLDLQANEKMLAKDEVEEMEFHVNNGSAFVGMQFTLQWNTNQLELEAIHGNEELKIGEDNYSILHSSEGRLSFSWNGEMKDGDLILNLRFKAKQPTKLSDAIQLTSGITPALSVEKENGDEGQVRLYFKGFIPDEFTVLQNEPNPWNHETTIGMLLPQTGEVSITVYDIAGKVFLRERKQMNKGYNEYILSDSQLGHSGVYYYQVDYQTNTITRKMIITK